MCSGTRRKTPNSKILKKTFYLYKIRKRSFIVERNHSFDVLVINFESHGIGKEHNKDERNF